ncbi:MAG: hypothetical protein O7B25_06480 [Gammaproteobacteria bacterium]|nr:hypothetical protein [Gammaproteobacteria bacterium]
MLRRRQIVQDWIRVEDFEVGSSEYRSFEYHVVADEASARMTLTIKCLNADCTAVRRLDPTELPQGTDHGSYEAIATTRVKQLFANGKI